MSASPQTLPLLLELQGQLGGYSVFPGRKLIQNIEPGVMGVISSPPAPPRPTRFFVYLQPNQCLKSKSQLDFFAT